MKTLTISKFELLNGLTNLTHVGASHDQWPYLVAINHDDREPAARVIWADTPSNQGSGLYFTNLAGETNHDLHNFTDPNSSYTWGEDENDTLKAAEEWIEENLLDQVDLDGQSYKVKYQ